MKALYIIHRDKDLLVFDFELDEVDNVIEFIEICNFHFEERFEPIKENAIMIKENYFEKESNDTWDVVDVVVLNAL